MGRRDDAVPERLQWGTAAAPGGQLPPQAVHSHRHQHRRSLQPPLLPQRLPVDPANDVAGKTDVGFYCLDLV